MPELEFHSREYGWVPAEPIEEGHPEAGAPARQGTLHLKARLPGGRIVYRRSVAHEDHEPVINVLAGGRCRLCGLTDAEHEHATGRVYRKPGEAGEPRKPAAARETEPPPSLPEPRTPADARAQAPRTTHT